MEDERCPGCRGLIIDGVCPFCTSPIEGLPAPALDVPDVPEDWTGPAKGQPSVALWIAVNILAALAGLYWLGIGVRLAVVSIDNRPGSGGLISLGVALICLAVGAYGVRAAWSLVRRNYTAQGKLIFAGFLGLMWATLLCLMSESWFFAVVMPLHLVVAIFAMVGARHFERAFY